MSMTSEQIMQAMKELTSLPKEEQVRVMRALTSRQSEELLSRTNTEEEAQVFPTELPNLRDASNWPDGDEISDWEILAYFGESMLGDAKLYARLNRGMVVYVRYWERFLVWAGHHWEDDHYGIAFQRIESVVKLYERVATLKKNELEDKSLSSEEKRMVEGLVNQLDRRIKQLRSKQGQENLLTQITRIPYPLVVLPDEIDKKYFSLACPNGVVDLKTGIFRPGVPDDYILNYCATQFAPELMEVAEPCPETSRFLLSSMNGDQELVDFIWRILGYGLIRERSDHKFIVFWGAHGRNGKDTLIKLVTKVLGKNLSGDVPVEVFLQTGQARNSAAPSPDILALKGMCLAWINEAEDGQKFAMARLKKLTGGGEISGRGLQDKKATTFEQTHLPIMTTNELPRSKSEDSAFWARMIIVKWELSFVDDPKEDYERPADKHLDAKVQEEAQGVLAMMVRGAIDYLKNGLQIPEKVKAWTTEQRDSLDDIAEFLEECCIMEEKRELPAAYSLRIKASDLRDCWNIWYAENRDRKHIPGGRTLSLKLDQRDIPRIRSNGTWRLGLELKPDWRSRVEDEQQRSASRRDTSSYVQNEF